LRLVVTFDPDLIGLPCLRLAHAAGGRITPRLASGRAIGVEAARPPAGHAAPLPLRRRRGRLVAARPALSRPVVSLPRPPRRRPLLPLPLAAVTRTGRSSAGTSSSLRIPAAAGRPVAVARSIALPGPAPTGAVSPTIRWACRP
jgi:hypothetical protein